MPETQKETGILEKIASSSMAIGISASFGLICSTFNPFILPRALSALKKQEETYFNRTSALSLLAGYSLGVSAIAYNIAENPRNPSSYIPIIANAAFFIYSKSCEDRQ